MSKRILLLCGNYYPEPTGIGKYTGEMMDWLAKQGHDCNVVTTFPYYPHWSVQAPYKKRCWWYKTETRKPVGASKCIQIVRCPHYVPQNPTGLKRLLSDLSFVLSAAFVIIRSIFHPKYDTVISISPPFLLGILALTFKWFRGSRVIYHIQDLQVEAARDLKMIKSAFLIKLLFSIEDFLLRQVDIVSAVSEGISNKVMTRCKRNVVLFPNWVDTEVFFPIQDKRQLKASFNFHEHDKVVLYSGGIGEKQGIESIIYAAKSLEHFPEIKFVVCGSGPYKKKLQQLSKNSNLKNVTFLPLQPVEKLNELLNLADLHLVLQKLGAGDLVMPSKLTTICAVGGAAIITAKPSTNLFDLVHSNSIGILIDCEDQLQLNLAIERAVFNLDKNICINARAYAVDALSTESIISRFQYIL